MKSKNFFLVTSSIKSLFPEKNVKTLLLGEWCKTNINNDFLSKYNTEIVPYHWANEKKRAKGYKYIMPIYRKISIDLAKILNDVHNTNFSKKYWQQIVGPWLYQFTIMAYDKYCLARLLKKYKLVGTRCIKISNDERIPQDCEDSMRLFQSDLWNNYIFSFFIRKLYPKLKIHQVKNDLEKTVAKKNFSYKENLKKIISFLSNLIRNEKEIFVINSYLKTFQEILLQIKLNRAIKINANIDYKKKFKLNEKLRSSMIKKKSGKKFYLILKELVMKNIPTFYLEGYNELAKFSNSLPWPKKPPIIFTSNNDISDDVFKFWLAKKRENNIPLVVGQHGGGWLIPKYFGIQDWQIINSDKVLFWGKKKFKNSKIIPLFNLKSCKNILKKKSFGSEINIIQDFPFRYTMRLCSTAISFSEYKKKIEFEHKFIKNLKSEILKKVKIRLSAAGVGLYGGEVNYEKMAWRNQDPNLKLESRLFPIKKSIHDSRIVICTAIHATLFLECISSDIPCFLFVDYDKNCISKECQTDLNNLRKIGILQESPEKFSNFINKYLNNIEFWWNSKKVRYEVNKFREKYCSIENKPIIKLSKVLKQNFKPETHNI